MFNGHGSAECAILTNFPFMKNFWLPRPHRYNCSDVDALSNGIRLPVALFGGCNCGDFNTSDCPIAWKFIAHESGGAIASIACTAGATMILGSLCVKSFHGYLLMRIFSAYAEGINRVGDLWCESIRTYLNDADVMALGDAFSQFNWRDNLANHYVLEPMDVVWGPDPEDRWIFIIVGHSNEDFLGRIFFLGPISSLCFQPPKTSPEKSVRDLKNII